MIARRSVVAGIGALPGIIARAWADEKADARFVACARTPTNLYVAVVLDASGAILAQHLLPDRGHGGAISPNNRTAVVFGRRPATYFAHFPLDGSGTPVVAKSPNGRHFYGHGCFSADGKHLFTTENDFEHANGIVGVYDATENFKRIGEFSSGGIGPHELILLSDKRTLAIANGGIETHPDFPRQKLNLASMRPNLTYIDTTSGDITETVEAPANLHQLSLRHIAEASNNNIWIGGQFEGPLNQTVPLIATHRRGDPLTMVRHDGATKQLRQYVGSVACSRNGDKVAVTSPRGNTLQIWNNREETLLETHILHDVCGVAPGEISFINSDGSGAIRRGDSVLSETPGWSWDNHITSTCSQANI